MAHSPSPPTMAPPSPVTRQLSSYVRLRWALCDLGLPAYDRLADVESFELRVPEIERLVVAGVAMRGPERFGLGPGFEGGAVRPYRVGRIKRVIVGFGA